VSQSGVACARANAARTRPIDEQRKSPLRDVWCGLASQRVAAGGDKSGHGMWGALIEQSSGSAPRSLPAIARRFPP